jgi:hypothetical protein
VVITNKKVPSVELGRIKTWQKHKLAQCSLTVIRGKDLAAYRDERVAAGKNRSQKVGLKC